MAATLQLKKKTKKINIQMELEICCELAHRAFKILAGAWEPAMSVTGLFVQMPKFAT